MKVKTSRREGHQHVIELPDNIGGGDSAYQVAVNNGFVGTEAEWLASLEGSDGVNGEDGADGASAYAIALANGFVGTQAEWLASLEGADGLDPDVQADIDSRLLTANKLSEFATTQDKRDALTNLGLTKIFGGTF